MYSFSKQNITYRQMRGAFGLQERPLTLTTVYRNEVRLIVYGL